MTPDWTHCSGDILAFCCGDTRAQPRPHKYQQPEWNADFIPEYECGRKQMLLSNVLICMRSFRVCRDRLDSTHITSKSLRLLQKSHHRVSILIDLTVSQLWLGGIVQWFPDLINAGEKSRRGPKKGDKISDRISGSPGLTVGWSPVSPLALCSLCVRLLPANVIKLFYRLSG